MLTAAIIAFMMEAVSTSETSVNFYKTTRCNMLEGSHVKRMNYRQRQNMETLQLNIG
jgi:hypothetical protein